MEDKEQKPLLFRLLTSIGSLMLIGSLVYIVVAGIDYYSGVILAVAFLGLAGPCVVAGEGVFEILAGFVEIFVEGLTTALEGVVEALGSLFNF